MKASRIFVALVLAAVAAAAAGAQTPPTLSLEVGREFGYNLATNAIGNSFAMTLGIGLADKLRCGLTFLPGDGAAFANYQLLELSYALFPMLAIKVSVGSIVAGGAVVGVGIYSSLFGRTVQGSLQTGFKLTVDYLGPVGAGFPAGLIRLGIGASVGI
jgi:hypothetical protein